MKRWEAEEADVTAQAAIAECRRHGQTVIVRPADNALVEDQTGDLVAIPDADGLYSGETVLAWLGY